MTGTSRASQHSQPTQLPPAARLLWRSARAAQLEIGARRVVLDGVGTDAVRQLVGRDATAEVSPSVALLQHELVEAGLLWVRSDPSITAGETDPATTTDTRVTPPHPRLSAELTALSGRVGDQAARLLHARRAASVVVQGGGRAGPHLAAVLAAAGVGRVHVANVGTSRLHHLVPGGLVPEDEGKPFHEAAARAIRRHAPDADCLPLPFGDLPDLVVLALDEPVDGERRDALHARGIAHLSVRLASDAGSVGPLVLPGLTSCLRCADLHRLDRDPAWNALAVQLTVPHRANLASEVALATVIAGLAAVQALDFLDGGRPATIEGALEMQLPDWRLRRRTWPVHPDCDCMIVPSERS